MAPRNGVRDLDVQGTKAGYFADVATRIETNEKTNSSLAISNGELFIRTGRHLYCIREFAEKAPEGR